MGKMTSISQIFLNQAVLVLIPLAITISACESSFSASTPAASSTDNATSMGAMPIAAGVTSSRTAIVPTISQWGYGCDYNQCLWITGTNFSTSCTVNIYAGDWSTGTTPLKTLTGSNVSCSNDMVTFQIPAEIQAIYTSINVNVVNLGYGTWTIPQWIPMQKSSSPEQVGSGHPRHGRRGDDRPHSISLPGHHEVAPPRCTSLSSHPRL